MNRVALLVGGFVVLPLLIFLGISLSFDPHEIKSPLKGQPAPTFALVDLYGRTVSLEELRGQPVVINFWATWCQPCMVEHPVLLEGSRRYRGKAHFVGVIYQDSPQAIQRFLAQSGSWGPSLVDPGGEVAIAYGVYGAPETFFVDSKGVVVEKVTGAIQPATLVDLLENLLDS